jgi:putative addiction module killer protein
MASEPRTLRIYVTSVGTRPFEEWIESFKNRELQATILARLERVRLGLLGDWKLVGGGVLELRVNAGPGYRVYVGQDGRSIVILLCGGSKATQRGDIANAKRYWADYRSRKNANKRIV